MRSLWIHGWASDSQVFAPLLAELPSGVAEGATLVDLPGAGGYAQYLRGLIEAESSRGPLLLAGWSLGAMAALEAAATAGKRVAALVLISGCARFVRDADNPGGQDPRALRAMIRRLERDSAPVVEQFQAAMFAGGEEGPRDAYINGRGKNYQAIPAKKLAHGLRYLLQSDFRPGLSKITCPVLLVHGERDTVIDISLARALAGSLDDASLCALDRAGHAPLLTRAGETARLIAEFIAERQRVRWL